MHIARNERNITIVGFRHIAPRIDRGLGNKMLVTREYRVPNGFALQVEDAALGIQVFVDGVSAMGFRGKSQKPAFYIRFRSVERLNEYVQQFVDSAKARVEQKAKERAERNAKVRELVVGDVLVDSWGYEQTNVDYYQVVGLVGKASVKIRAIGQIAEVEGQYGDRGLCVPAVDRFVGEEMVKKVCGGDRVRINSFSSAHKKEFQVVAGVKVFRGDYWSSYA